MTSSAVSNDWVAELGKGFAGPLLQPNEPGYDDARKIWNGSGDRRPALIARCTGVSDVIAAVRFARKTDVLTAVRGGGHSIPGHSCCDDGLMIDLSPMKGIRVDPRSATAQAQPGVKWGEFDRETAVFGLAVPGGYVSTTGIAGLTLGGGIGWLGRKHGLTCDNLIGADVVTAAGDLVHVSEDENEDLFWGLRGGGGNFGIVTTFEYQLHSVPSVLGGALIYKGQRLADVLPRFSDFALAAPNELTTLGLMITAPAGVGYPNEMEGAPVLYVGVCYAGDAEDGQRVLDELRAEAPPDLDTMRAMSYPKLQAMIDDGGWGLPWYEKAAYASEITDEALETVVAGWDRRTSTRSQLYMQQMGGKIAEVSDDATPFSNRDTQFVYMAMNGWRRGEDPTPHVQWARDVWNDLQPHTKPGVYVNFDSEDGGDRVQATYGPKYERLSRLKAKYDPGNLFRLNQNIRPAEPAAV
jgi:FAD/FMN-containing dehydrogenase